MGMLKEGVKSILGKRHKLPVLADGEAKDDSNNGKKVKVGEDLTVNEAAGVLQHSC